MKQLLPEPEELRDGHVSAIAPRIQAILAAVRWGTALINSGFSVLLALITISVPWIYVSHERYFYYWDSSNFHNLTSATALAFRQSPYWAMRGVVESLANDYNKLFTIPLLPFILTFGDSRLVYVLSVALVYLLPFALVMGAIGTELIPLHRRAVFWSAALLTLLTPTVWATTLRGYPDVGAALLISVAVLVYLHDIRLGRWWQIVLIGFCIAAAALFRRHFAYAGVAFFISITVQALIAFAGRVRQQPYEAWRHLFQSVRRICLAGAASLLALAVLGWPFVYKLLTIDYTALYASYDLPAILRFRFYVASYGWASWVLAGLGFAVGIYSRAIIRPAAMLIVLLGSCSLLQWVVLLHNVGIGVQFTLNFTPFVVLGLTAMGWMVCTRLRGTARALASGLGFTYLILNFVIGLGPVDILKNAPIRQILSANYPPPVRADYAEIAALVRYLRSVASQKEPIYVAASSHSLNWSILRSADRILYGRNQTVLNVLVTPEVDSRDSYPLERLLQAQYVVIATPFQYHMPEKQYLVKVVFVAFTENWEIAHDFERLPAEFHLANGAIVNIYRRTRATSLGTALATLQAIREIVGRRPGGQRDWIILNDSFNPSVGKNRDGTFRIRTRLGYGAKTPLTSFLYIGTLPEKATVTGTLTLDDPRCSDVRLSLTAISGKESAINYTEAISPPLGMAAFALTPQTRGAAYLLLTVSRDDESLSIECSLQIDNLAVSSR